LPPPRHPHHSIDLLAFALTPLTAAKLAQGKAYFTL
jgi:hypothetical protein